MSSATSNPRSVPFAPVENRQNFPALEEKILAFWRNERVFEKSLSPIDEKTGQARPMFVFYEGPPTANGKPGIHHVLARAFKDVIPRFKTMRGYHVPRKAGWDCHGLPVEVEVEKRLGLTGKKQIEELGVAEFNRRCRESVFQYIKDWDRLTDRIGFWLDTDHPYRTLDNEYIESCWALLRQLWDRSLLVRDYKVTKHCPRCGTSLAEAEAGQGMKDDVDDPSVFVRLRLKPGQKLPFADETTDTPTALLIWTTTPWTLPANAAAALSAKGEYALCVDPKNPGARILLLASQAQAVLGDKKTQVTLLGKAMGDALAGLRYEPLFPGVGPGGAAIDLSAAYRLIVDETVELGEGSGIVHIAPAYGDLDVGRRHGLPVLFSIGLDGMVLPAFPQFAGMFFKEADPHITRDLKERGLLLSSGRVRHSYPFCWRCDTPLIYLAKESWYIRTTAVRDQLLQQNSRINWYPEHIKEGRFGDWLRNNVDWAISRERYWGTPLPLWICDKTGQIECIGSIDELSQKVGRDLRRDADFDLHRPYVDGLTWPSAGGGTMRRVRDVIDCWFDSGAMPYAQHHFPFQHEGEFDQLFPAAFICEAVDQTRGWFYTLHALGVLLRGGPAFQNCIVLGHILDEQGRKMSKRLGNIVDPWTVLNAEGADALRYYMYTASPPGQPRRFSQALVQKSLRQYLLTLWNCYSFFVTYAETEWHRLKSEPIADAELPALDQWIVGVLSRLVIDTTHRLETYDLTAAARGISDFVDTLSNWYIRRSRDRFWASLDRPAASGGGIDPDVERDKRAAYQTLRRCLVTVAQLSAPFTPFVAEELWQNLERSVHPQAAVSVHLSVWPQKPDAAFIAATESICQDMSVVLRVVSLGRAARMDQNIKVRQPLHKVLVQVPNAAVRQAVLRHEAVIRDELNVERVQLVEGGEQLVHYTLRPNLPKLGKKYGKRVKPIQDALLAMQGFDAARVAEAVLAEKDLSIATADGPFALEADEVLLSAQAPEGLAARTEEGVVVAITTEITPELRDRGLARELVRAIGELRKKAGCRVSDRVHIGAHTTDGNIAAALARHQAWIEGETLSTLSPQPLSSPMAQSVLDLDEATVDLSLRSG
ncbi:MAG: isoleucine--tRNA ligase [Myxococcales bacterium]|nr:isoleucine--tRNA ligase [Myxococcales bacterium]